MIQSTQVKVMEPGRRKARLMTVNELPSLTEQSHRDRANIREILKRYRQVGIVDHLRQVDLVFRDVSEFADYADMARSVRNAEGEFMKLPPQLRDVFANDVYEWLDAAHRPEKLEELRPKLEELGVLEPLPAPVAPEAPAAE